MQTAVDAPIKRELIMPKSELHWHELRTVDLTSTDIAALFGVSPYMTEFELWHRKKNQTIVEVESNERMKWGTRLQDSIAAGIAEDEGWKFERMAEYVRIPEERLGSSFDYKIEYSDARNSSDENHQAVTVCRGILETKNVDSLAFRDGWIEDDFGNIEAPPHIELQVQHQLLVNGSDVAYIGALVGGNRRVLIRREPDPNIIKAIRRYAAEFWQSIDAGREPSPNFLRDAEMISKIYGYAEPGKVLDVRGDASFAAMVDRYKTIGKAEKEAGEIKASIKAELLTIIGDAEKVLGDGFTISAGIMPEAVIETYTRKPYRSFRANFKKEKAAAQ